MKALLFLAPLCASFAWAQATPPASTEKPETIVATFEDGTKMTLGEYQALVPLLSETYRPLAERDPERFMHVYAVIKKAAASAESQNLRDKAPFKQAIDFAVMEALARFYVQESTAAITVAPEEIEKYYNDHKEPFRRIKVSGIKVAFATAPEAGGSSVMASRVTKKVLTEDEAKAKAEKLVVQIRGGADFAKLVQTESDDENSKAKGGDLGVWSQTDNVPDDLRAAVLSLKEGEVSDPIRQPGGFYIVHADSASYAPLDDVKDAIFTQLKQEKSKDWLTNLDKSVKVDLAKKQEEPAPSPSDPKK